MTNLFRMFGEGEPESIARRLEKGLHVPGAELTAALRKCGTAPLPASVLEYVCAHLEGKVQRRRGRKRHDGSLDVVRRHLAVVDYERYLAWLLHRKARRGLAGPTLIQEAEWWRGSPHERAAKMVRKRYYRQCDWRYVLNLVSASRNQRRL